MRPCKVVLRTIVLRRTVASLEIGQPTRCTSNGPNWLSRRPSVRSCGKISERRSLSLRYGLFWKLSMSGGTADIMASRRAKCGHLQVHDLSNTHTIMSSGGRSAGCSPWSSSEQTRRRGGCATSHRPPVSCVGSPSPICKTCTRPMFKRPRCHPAGLGFPRSLAEILVGKQRQCPTVVGGSSARQERPQVRIFGLFSTRRRRKISCGAWREATATRELDVRLRCEYPLCVLWTHRRQTQERCLLW